MVDKNGDMRMHLLRLPNSGQHSGKMDRLGLDLDSLRKCRIPERKSSLSKSSSSFRSRPLCLLCSWFVVVGKTRGLEDFSYFFLSCQSCVEAVRDRVVSVYIYSTASC